MSMLRKAELHLHLDGSLPYPTIERLSRENGCDPGGKPLCDLVRVPEGCAGLEEYLRCFDFVTPLLQREEALTDAAHDLIKSLEAEGLAYAEIRFAPQLHTARGMTQQQAVEAVLRGVRRAGSGGAGIEIGILLCMMVTGERRANRETAELAAAYLGRGVAGLDLAGAEGAVPIGEFEPLFSMAYRAGVPFTVHAGECGDCENVRKAVAFGARRIGHGCGAVLSRECMELLRREKIVIEACPTSNLQTRAVAAIEEHPVRRFFDEGIPVTISTDNRTVSDTSLDREYLLLKEKLNFTDGEIREMNETALRAGFLFETGKGREPFKTGP